MTGAAIATAVALLLVGYVLGRLRLGSRLDDWMWRHEPARRAPRWWLREAYCAVLLASRPRATIRALRAPRQPPEPVRFSGAAKPKDTHTYKDGR